MAQTTGAKSMRNAYVAWNTQGFETTWIDISGVANSIEVSGGDRITGEVYTSQGDTPIVLFGKLEPRDVTGRIVYSEVTTEAFTQLLALYSAGTNLRMRWIPGGQATNNFRYTTDTTNLTSFSYPGGAVEDGDPIMIEFAVKIGAITYVIMTSATLG
jgi:hypothetical protein